MKPLNNTSIKSCASYKLRLISPRTIDFLETWWKSPLTVIWKLLKTYLIFWCKTCNHRRVCRRFLKEVESSLTLGVLVLLLRLQCADGVLRRLAIFLAPNDTKASESEPLWPLAEVLQDVFSSVFMMNWKSYLHSKILESKFYLK